jgi:hypothetical protein
MKERHLEMGSLSLRESGLNHWVESALLKASQHSSTQLNTSCSPPVSTPFKAGEGMEMQDDGCPQRISKPDMICFTTDLDKLLESDHFQSRKDSAIWNVRIPEGATYVA